MKKNDHIEKYLDYYLGLKIAPEYALLIRGEWGAGKTWFIKNYMKNNKEVGYLYISLNGVTSYKEIEDSFFQQLHPILASNGMKIAGKVLKGLLKTTVSIDLNEDGKANAKVSSSIPEISFSAYLNNVDNKALIFDDVERCSMPITNTLGYINQFVEANGHKVILLANEEEIISQDSKSQEKKMATYLAIKEKVIGKSFNLQSDLDQALKYFIEQLDSQDCQTLLLKKDFLIRDLYERAKYNNLRHLRQAILDFERFFWFLPAGVDKKDDLIGHIIDLFFVISFELKKGALSEGDIHKLFLMDFWALRKDESKTNIHLIREKYFVFGNYHHPIDHTSWTSFFKFGTADKTLIRDSINNSTYFQKERTPNWIKLWHFYNLDDEEFEDLSKSEIQRFDNLEIRNKHELLQISGLFLNLSEKGLINYKKRAILSQSKKNIDTLKMNGHLYREKNEEFPALQSFGLQVQGENIKEFKEIQDYAYKETNSVLIDNYPEKGKDLLDTMAKSMTKFGRLVTLTNSINNIYADIPILKYIPVNNFLRVLMDTDNKGKKEFCRIVEERYRHRAFLLLLSEEIDWLAELHEGISKQKDKYSGKVSWMILNDLMLPTLKKTVEDMRISNIAN